ncbi:hypothetical protein ABFA07_019762 [Porites harrisoni]
MPAKQVRKNIKKFNLASKKKEQQRFHSPSGNTQNPKSCMVVRGGVLNPKILRKLDRGA